MAAPSRMMVRSSSAALGLFSKTMPVLNRQLPLRALPTVESAVSRLINQPAGSEEKIIPTQLPLWIARPQSAADEMLMARRPPRKVPDTEEEDDDEEVEDDSDIEMIDEEDEDEDDDDDDEFDDEDDEFVKTKVRTRSHRDL